MATGWLLASVAASAASGSVAAACGLRGWRSAAVTTLAFASGAAFAVAWYGGLR